MGCGGENPHPFPRDGRAELNPQLLEVLDLYAARIRSMAGEIKAVYRYITEEAQSMGLEFMQGWATLLVMNIVEYDRPIASDLLEGVEQDQPTIPDILVRVPRLPAGAIFLADERWALVWEDVEENPETARRLRIL